MTSLPAFDVTFDTPSFGWISFRLPSSLVDWEFRATHLEDPFPELLAWLEDIAAGAQTARWMIGEEGSVAQFVFVAAGDCGFDRVTAQLVVLVGNERGDIWHLGSFPTTARSVVISFYESLRAYATGDRYDATHWSTFDPETEEGWKGAPLDRLRSLSVEAFLRGAAVQPELPLRWPWDRQG